MLRNTTPSLKPLKRDVAAVIRHGGTHAGLDQVLDGRDGLGVGGIEELVAVSSPSRLAEQRLAGHEMFHDGAEDHRLELLPLAGALGHGDEVGAEEHAADAGNAEQPFGERRLRGLPGSRRSSVPFSSTARPGRNFRVAGFGVASVWMNMASASPSQRTCES